MTQKKALQKPTAAQQRVLDEIAEKGSFSCIDTYKPALGLIKQGRARVVERSSFDRITIVAVEKA